jgi:membrane-associated phospholipid phosphatase
MPGAPSYPFTQWVQDPVSQLMTALGGYWGEVRPFALTSGFQFRPAEQDSPNSKAAQLKPATYKNLPSFNAVRQWGRETRLDPTGKIVQPPPADDAFFVAQFWAYDATANLCAPARFYNQIALAVLNHIGASGSDGYANIDVNALPDVARYFALVNIALADAAVAGWDAKFHFQFPRPVTYIRANDAVNSAKPPEDPAVRWFPVGGQNTNSDQPFNVTPPFPAYPSGHAVFGGALFGTLRQFLKPAAVFKFRSDEFNGKNKDVFNYIRCSAED